MPLEDYVLLAPGLIAGRLSAEPWLALVGLALGLLLRPAWYVAFMAVAAGAAWGAISYYAVNEGGSIVEWMYLAALPVAACALVAYGVRCLIKQQRKQRAE
jgi:hypothetical protein